MGIKLQLIEPERFEPYAAANGAAFGWEVNPAQVEHTRQFFEFDRSLAAFDGEEIVGTGAIFSFDMTVPGGVLPTAGVTWISVKPTHRRRGVLTQIMARQLEDVRQRGEAVAALWASESIIYGRFGYGLAAEGVELRIEREHTALARPPETPGRVRFISHDDALRTWPGLYDAVRIAQPGMYTRSERWWEHKALQERPSSRSTSSYYVQYEEEGEPLGYARYRIRQGDPSGHERGTVLVLELMATTEAAYAALWRYLFGVDLIDNILAYSRRVDEPLFWMLADPRRLQRRPSDALWVRLVDVPAALEARRYNAEGRLVFDVRDAFCPKNEGRYELEGGPDGARCRRTDAEPDVALEIADLGAVYLGGGGLQLLRRAGRVHGDWAALRRADAMLGWNPAPWCPETF